MRQRRRAVRDWAEAQPPKPRLHDILTRGLPPRRSISPHPILLPGLYILPAELLLKMLGKGGLNQPVLGVDVD